MTNTFTRCEWRTNEPAMIRDHSREALDKRIDRLGSLAGKGGLWIAWPKKASGITTGLSQNEVRQTGLAAGLVDYKVCAIDATWSGLRFARRKASSSSL